MWLCPAGFLRCDLLVVALQWALDKVQPSDSSSWQWHGGIQDLQRCGVLLLTNLALFSGGSSTVARDGCLVHGRQGRPGGFIGLLWDLGVMYFFVGCMVLCLWSCITL